MNKFFIGLISIYQRYISPYKGFQCAHAYLHQGDSCSAAIKTIIADQGIIQGYGDIRHRFEACRYAYDDIQRQERKERKRKDRNDVCNTCSNSCDVASCIPDIAPCDCSL